MQDLIKRLCLSLILHIILIMNEYDLIIVGAGASGLVAGISASRFSKNILIVEKNNSAGKKLKITGNGRCNLTNSAKLDDFLKAFGKNGKFLYPSFLNFFSKDIINLLEEEGVFCFEEEDGRIFPKSNNSNDVLKAFLNKLSDVKIIFNTKIRDLILKDNTALGVQTENQKLFSKNVIIATGGCSYPITGSTGDAYSFAKKLGHQIVLPKPSLVPLESFIGKELQGVSLENILLSVYVNSKKQNEILGDIIFTHYGVSGPLILNLSKFIVEELLKKNKVRLLIDLIPLFSTKELDFKIIKILEDHPKMILKNVLAFFLKNKVCDYILGILKIDPNKVSNKLSKIERLSILKLMKEFSFEIVKSRPIEEAMITAGGVSLKDINPKTMGSKIVKNLYFVGEVLDLDAICGGFNLQSAFSTAWLAGEHLAKLKSI